MGPTEFTTSLHFAKTARGRIAVDDHLRVLVHSTRPEDHGPTTPGQVSSTVCTQCVQPMAEISYLSN